ncbi:hypothetical protein NHQ30_011547 [Ciborinia camelliae]|nr:hypothetical protein NHQ30_011547 [Ciborinia camelliae]
MLKAIFLFGFTQSMSLAIIMPPALPPPFTQLTISQWPPGLQDQAKIWPDGLIIDLNIVPIPLPARNISSISFYSPSPADGSRGGLCTGEQIVVLAEKFTGATLCPSAKNDVLINQGGSFVVDGHLADCQLHWYSAPDPDVDECQTGDWKGYMTGAMQLNHCMAPMNTDLKYLKSITSFAYFCPDI